MKWGRLYAPDYVNVLHRACREAACKPFRFVCLTDDPTGLDPAVEALPMPDIGLTAEEWALPGIWPKLAIYLPDLHGLRGRCLFIDLDTVVLRGLDDFFSFGSGLVATDRGLWRTDRRLGTGLVATSVFAFDIGKERQILERFLADRGAAISGFRNEQDFVAAHASRVEFWPEDWVVSFKRRLRRPIGLDLLLPPRRPPESARMVAFHGDPRPAALLRPGWGFWDRFPHMGHGQVKWMAEYWAAHGGRLPGINSGGKVLV